MNQKSGWNLECSYSKLPKLLWTQVEPTRVKSPQMARWNKAYGASLGFDFSDWTEDAAADYFSGNEIPPGSTPIAQAYAGQQYGGFTMLGDGRALLIGEQRTPNGTLIDSCRARCVAEWLPGLDQIADNIRRRRLRVIRRQFRR